MLFDYIAPDFQSGSQPAQVGTLWSQFPLQPLAPGALSPFSASVLTELTSRAWYLYYDRLGFDPTPRSRVVRRYKGHLYFNLSLSAQMEAANAALEPLTLTLNGRRHPLATWEKPGFLAAFKFGRAQKRIDDLLTEWACQMATTTEKARLVSQRSRVCNAGAKPKSSRLWEEIERVGAESMVAFLAARLNLGYLYTRLLADFNRQGERGKGPEMQGLLLINNALCEVPGLVEVAMLDTLPTIAEPLRQPAALAWLKAGDFSKWRTEAPSPEALAALNAFMGTYGHRAVHEGEIALARWSEDAGLLMQALLATTEAPPASPRTASKQAANANLQTLLAALPSSARKQGEQTIQKISELHKLQSSALHALAYIWAGTRSWALAAARKPWWTSGCTTQTRFFSLSWKKLRR